jgi:hypothetical protein
MSSKERKAEKRDEDDDAYWRDYIERQRVERLSLSERIDEADIGDDLKVILGMIADRLESLGEP